MESNSQIGIQSILLIVLIAGFFSFPLMLIMLVFTILYNQQQSNSEQLRYLMYALLGIGMGYINTTKPTENSDLGFYYWLYSWAATKPFNEYVSLIPKEPLYYIYNYLMRYLTFGNFKLFLIITTLGMYFPVMISFDRIIRHYNIPVNNAVITSVLLACFSEYFFYTAQIIRQVLAGSMAFYFIVRMTYRKDKLSYIGLACAGFVHASAFIFCIYYILQLIINWKLKYKLMIILVTFVLFGFLLSIVGVLSDADSTLGYAAHRAQIGAGDKITIGYLPLAVCISIVPLSLLIMWKSHWEKQLCNILILGIFLVGFVFTNLSVPLFVLRFMEYCYMYIPLCVVLALYAMNCQKLSYLVLVAMFIRFAISLGNSNFQYESFVNLCLEGYPIMLFKILS